MKDYWLRPTIRQESGEEYRKLIAVDLKRWEKRYAPFQFYSTSWAYMNQLAIVRGSKRPVPESWRTHGISHRYLAFGVPFGEPRDAIACLSIMTHHYGASAFSAKHFHQELIARLEEYSSDELRELAQLALEHYDEPSSYTFPPSLIAGRQPIPWRIPQRILSGGGEPVQVATMGAKPATIDQYDAIREAMRQLGSYSILIDLRDAPNDHRDLARRQNLKRNTFAWPREKAAQLLHPIGLRETFGRMKYRQMPRIEHFAKAPVTYRGGPEYPDNALPHKVQVWMHRPEMCAPIVDLIMQRRPLLLVDDEPVYEVSLRRAIMIHLLSLFSMQIEALPEKGGC